MQRGAINKREALRMKEELLDIKLKEAGCWDVGQTLDEKIRIYEFLQESEPTSNQEEHPINDAAESISSSQEIVSTSSPTDVVKNSFFQRDDSPEPMIMYDSFTNKSMASINQSRESSPEAELAIFPGNRNGRLVAADADPSCSSAQNSNGVDGHVVGAGSNAINFDKIDQQADNLDRSDDTDMSVLEKSDCSEQTSKPATEQSAAEARPLKYRRIKPIEDPSKVYYRNATETKEECVARILSLINEYHHKLKVYQRTLPNRIPRPPWITVKETTQIPPLAQQFRRLRSTQQPVAPKSSDVYEFNLSDTESSSEDTSDTSWIQCGKRQPVKRTKRTLSPHRDLQAKSPDAKRSNDHQEMDEGHGPHWPNDSLGGGVVAKVDAGDTGIPNGSAKRKTFTLGPNVPTEKRAATSDTEGSTAKKSKANSPDLFAQDVTSDYEDIQICPMPVIKRGRQYVRRHIPFVNAEKQVEEQPHVELPQPINDPSPTIQVPTVEEELVSCPLCQKRFPIPEIEAHASDCMVEDTCQDAAVVRSGSDDVVCL